MFGSGFQGDLQKVAFNMDLQEILTLRGDLAERWESRACVRARARENQAITMWPQPSQVGVATSPACSLNSVPLTLLASWWTKQVDEPQAVPIGILRTQAQVVKLYVSNHGGTPVTSNGS